MGVTIHHCIVRCGTNLKTVFLNIGSFRTISSMVEHGAYDAVVVGSIPTWCTSYIQDSNPKRSFSDFLIATFVLI